MIAYDVSNASNSSVSGSGKTFLALHMAHDMLRQANESQKSTRILFVARNRALCLYFCQWLVLRMLGEMKNNVAVVNEFNTKHGGIWILHVDKTNPPDQNSGVCCQRVTLESHNTTRERSAYYKLCLQDDPAYIDFAVGCKFDYVIVDEAHHVFATRGGDVLQTQVDPYLQSGKRVFCYDKNQAPDGTVSNLHVKYPATRTIELTECVRFTKRTMGALSEFMNEGGKLRAHHNSFPGPPLKPFLFNVVDENEPTATPAEVKKTAQAFWYDANIKGPLGEDEPVDGAYAEGVWKALQWIRSHYDGIPLHNNVAVLTRTGKLAETLKEILEDNVKRSSLTAIPKVEFISAEASATFVCEDDSLTADPTIKIVLDEINAFDGMERLIVVAVDLDERPTKENEVRVRSNIYRALSRAHMFVAVVQNYIQNGFLAHLRHNTLDCNREVPGVVTADPSSVQLTETSNQGTTAEQRGGYCTLPRSKMRSYDGLVHCV